MPSRCAAASTLILSSRGAAPRSRTVPDNDQRGRGGGAGAQAGPVSAAGRPQTRGLDRLSNPVLLATVTLRYRWYGYASFTIFLVEALESKLSVTKFGAGTPGDLVKSPAFFGNRTIS